MPHVLDLDLTRPTLENLDELRFAGQTFRLMPDLPLGLIQDLQNGIAAAMTARQSAATAGAASDVAEAAANTAMNEHFSIDTFAFCFHPEDQAQFRKAMRNMFMSDLAKLFEFIVNRSTGGAVPLDGLAPSSRSPEPRPSTSNVPLSSLVPQSDFDNSQPAGQLPGSQRNLEPQSPTPTATKSVFVNES